MQIGCTKKLQEFLKKDIIQADQDMDPFYTWSASIMIVNRRKTIVVLHDESRCGFVLYGMTSRHLREMDCIIQAGIQDMLTAHGISIAMVERYLQECGHISYTTPRGRNTVAHLNYFCEQVTFFSEAFIPVRQFQSHLVQALNEDLVKIGEEYVDPRENLRESFSEHYPEQSVLSRKMAILDIKLLDTPCFRRLCISSHCSLMQLHWAIQILFSWKDAHLHVFETEDGHSLDIDFPEYSFLMSEDDWEQSAEAEMERYLSVGEVFEQNRIIRYVYDPGNYWIHQIALASWKEDAHNSKPSCILAAVGAPLEDTGNDRDGGTSSFATIKESSHQKTAGLQQWADFVGKQALEMLPINKALRKL